MTVDDLVKLISNEKGEIYPFSYAANMMAAHGVNEKLVAYFHDAATRANRASYDRACILNDFSRATGDGEECKAARRRSFLRLNPHVKERSDA